MVDINQVNTLTLNLQIYPLQRALREKTCKPNFFICLNVNFFRYNYHMSRKIKIIFQHQSSPQNMQKNFYKYLEIATKLH